MDFGQVEVFHRLPCCQVVEAFEILSDLRKRHKLPGRDRTFDCGLLLFRSSGASHRHVFLWQPQQEFNNCPAIKTRCCPMLSTCFPRGMVFCCTRHSLLCFLVFLFVLSSRVRLVGKINASRIIMHIHILILIETIVLVSRGCSSCFGVCVLRIWLFSETMGSGSLWWWFCDLFLRPPLLPC